MTNNDQCLNTVTVCLFQHEENNIFRHENDNNNENNAELPVLNGGQK